jgi:hypothetical protein
MTKAELQAALKRETEARIRAEHQRTTLLSKYHTRGMEIEKLEDEIARLTLLIP